MYNLLAFILCDIAEASRKNCLAYRIHVFSGMETLYKLSQQPLAKTQYLNRTKTGYNLEHKSGNFRILLKYLNGFP